MDRWTSDGSWERPKPAFVRNRHNGEVIEFDEWVDHLAAWIKAEAKGPRTGFAKPTPAEITQLIRDVVETSTNNWVPVTE